MNTGVIDLGVSNLQSVMRAFRRIGVDVALIRSRRELEAAQIVVLPGVGAFRDGMARLNELGLVDPLRKLSEERRTPIAGICLGMQLLADESEEHGRYEGLGLVPGRVVRLTADLPGYRVPNIGWCDLRVARPTPLVPGEVDGQAAYFVHSYQFVCEEPADAVATIDFSGKSVVAAIERGHLFGLQFHPEKSQDTGLTILEALVRNATSLAREAA